jgi:hypothetical protein
MRPIRVAVLYAAVLTLDSQFPSTLFSEILALAERFSFRIMNRRRSFGSVPFYLPSVLVWPNAIVLSGRHRIVSLDLLTFYASAGTDSEVLRRPSQARHRLHNAIIDRRSTFRIAHGYDHDHILLFRIGLFSPI